MTRLLPLLLFLCLNVAKAQTNGLIADDEAYDQAPLIEKDSTRGSDLRIAVDMRNYCPTAGDQGDLPSCVAWALANALTMQEARQQQQTDLAEIDKMRFSVSYIYNQIKHNGDCYLGATFSKGLELLKTKGDCRAEVLGYSLDCNPMPKAVHHSKAAPFRIKNYKRLFTSTSTMDERIDRILEKLNDNIPVVVGLGVPSNFRENIPAVGAPWPVDELHAVVVVGFVDIGAGKFILLNSYGQSWGQKGFFEMDFDTLGKVVRYAYVMEL